jgi:transcriptional regulator with XRE-family HTH domain
MPKQRYTTLVDYMERTGTTARRLLERANQKLRRPLSEPMFSMILRGSRRMSAENAWALHQVTGVPMDELMRWPRYEEQRNSQSVA